MSERSGGVAEEEKLKRSEEGTSKEEQRLISSKREGEGEQNSRGSRESKNSEGT